VTRLAGLSALVTGGGTGMGRAIALAFAREGAKVAVAARRVDKLQGVVFEIEEGCGKGLAVECDVTRRADAERAVRQTAERFGQLNILVNNAGVLSASTVEGIAEEEWDRLMAANLKGPFLMSRAVLPEFRKVGGWGDREYWVGAGIDSDEESCGLLCQQRRRDHADEGHGGGSRA